MKERSHTLAFCAVLSALGVALLLGGGLIPVATYAAPLLASLLLIPAVSECGAGWGWRVWAVTALLTLLLDADREAAFFYLFLGYYPLLRREIEGRTPRPLRWAVKLGWAALSVGVMYALLCFAFGLGELLEEEQWVNAAFFLLLCAVMLLFDRCLTPMTILYEKKLRPRLGRR